MSSPVKQTIKTDSQAIDTKTTNVESKYLNKVVIEIKDLEEFQDLLKTTTQTNKILIVDFHAKW